MLDDLLITLKGDGRCTFDIVKDGDVEYGMATAAELTHAATSLMDTCVGERNGLGGSVLRVGKHMHEAWIFRNKQ